MTTPLRVVLDAVEDGVTTVAAIAARTGLSVDVVQAAVDHLRRLNRLSTLELRTVCAGGCSACETGCSVGPSNRHDVLP